MVKLVRGKISVKRRGVGGREVTISIRKKMIKVTSQRKNERFDDICRANAIFTTNNFQYLSPRGS